MKYVRFFGWLGLLGGLALMGCGWELPENDVTGGVTDTLQRTISVAPGGTLELDLDQGDITVETAQQESVHVTVARTVEANSPEQARERLEEHPAIIERRGEDVYVRVRCQNDGPLNFWPMDLCSDLEIHMRATVPEAFDVHFETGTGNMTVSNLQGAVRGETGAGNIHLENVTGPVQVHSGAGNTEVEGVEERLVVETGAGNVRLHGLRGPVRVETGAGNVTASFERTPQEASELSSGAGNVSVYLPRQADLRVRASTGLGSIRTTLPLAVEGGRLNASVDDTLGAGGPLLRLNTGMGNVVIEGQGEQ